MNRRLFVGAFVLASFGASSGLAQPTEAAMSELRQLRSQYSEKYIALQKRRLFSPRCETAVLLRELMSTRAKNAGMTGLTLTPDERSVPILLHDGYPSPLRIVSFEMRGQGAFTGLFSLLRFVAQFRDVGVVELATLNVTAGTSEAVRFDVRVDQACWDEGVEVGHTKTPRGADYAQTDIARYRAWVQDVDAAAEAVTHVENMFQPMPVVWALAVVNRDWTGRGVRLTEADLAARTLTLRGIARGPAAKTAVDTTIHKAGLGSTRIDWSGNGDCAVFIATILLAPPSGEKLDTVPASIFDNRTSDICGQIPSRSPQ